MKSFSLVYIAVCIHMYVQTCILRSTAVASVLLATGLGEIQTQLVTYLLSCAHKLEATAFWEKGCLSYSSQASEILLSSKMLSSQRRKRPKARPGPGNMENKMRMVHLTSS